MNFEHIVSDNIGLIHLVASLFALISGTWVLIKAKGTRMHKQGGYVYAISMTIVLITSFMMYNLYGKFGIFHWLALLSSITLAGGILPMFLKKPSGYISLHFNFMYWSVFGLYGAFAAEIMVRIPKSVISNDTINPVFYNLVGLAVFVVMGVAYFIFKRKKKSWSSFDTSNINQKDI